MELSCSFITSHAPLAAIWEGGCALYLRLQGDPLALAATPNTLPPFMEVHLALTADIDGAVAILKKVYEALIDTANESPSREICALQYALALETLATYQTVHQDMGVLLGNAEKLFSLVENMSGKTPEVEAHLLGCALSLDRVRAALGHHTSNTDYGRRGETYHKAFYSTREGLYRVGENSLMPSLLAAYYGYVSDDSYDNVRDMLLSHSYEVETASQNLLPRALYQLDAPDALLPTLLECGCPTEDGAPCAVAQLAAMLTLLFGVDLEMLGKGIRMATPSLPESIGYRLVLPSPGGYIAFDGGDETDEFFG